MDFDASDFLNHLSTKERNVIGKQKRSMEKVTDDLGRISSEIAPIKGSDLRKSVNKEVKVTETGVVGEVSFNVTEISSSGRFNYALWTHEQDYNLGDRSAGAPGTDGYSVGNKYLERPLKGEAEKYVNMWAKDVESEMD